MGKGKETFFSFAVVDRGSKQVRGFPRAKSIISGENSPGWENEVHGEEATTRSGRLSEPEGDEKPLEGFEQG